MQIFKAVNQKYLGQGFDYHPAMKKFYEDLGMNAHGGYDYSCNIGTPIYWNCDLQGEVIYNEVDGGGGLGCSVLAKYEDRVFKFRFWHFSKFGSFQGEMLKKGMLIGWSGNTGKSTGPHLHFDVKELIPSANGKYAGLGDRYDQKYPNNGTFGTIRIEEFMKDIFVFDTLTITEKINRLLIRLVKNIIYK